PTGWTGATLITQSLWGAIFCVAASFSFNALRFSTLTSALAGPLGVYVLFLPNIRNRLLAVTAALILAFNLIYYSFGSLPLYQRPLPVNRRGRPEPAPVGRTLI